MGITSKKKDLCRVLSFGLAIAALLSTPLFGAVVCPNISMQSSRAYALLNHYAVGHSDLYSVNLTTGAAKFVGSRPIIEYSFAIDPSGYGFAVDQVGTTLSKFSLSNPSVTLSSLPITGPGDPHFNAIDFRPANGLLYGLRVAGTGPELYTIDTTTGVATPVGSAPFNPSLSYSFFGFDFDPVSDRIRVVSDSGQNLRVNPDTGAVEAVDTPLNGGSATKQVGAAAYTNSYAGATATTLYDIDADTDSLYIQNPPNSGTLTLVGSLGQETGPAVGFDIAMLPALLDGTVGVAYGDTLVANGGTPPYTFSITAGALPDGVFLAMDGVLSGTPIAAGTFSFTVTATDANSCSGSQSYVVHIAQPVTAPSDLVATGTNPTSIEITWTASPSPVDHYEVWRWSNPAIRWARIATTNTTSYVDTGGMVTEDSAQVYKVRAVDTAYNVSTFSNSYLGSTFTFSDDPLVPGVTKIQALHFYEMRAAIDVIQHVADTVGDGGFHSFVEPGQIPRILALTEMEDRLNSARSALGLTPITFPPRSQFSPIGAVEFNTLRNGMR
jgi:hypothetical protein